MKRSLNAFVSPLLKSDSRSFSVFVFCMSESKMGCSKVYHSLDVIFLFNYGGKCREKCELVLDVWK